MTDIASHWLADRIRQESTAHSLWFCDENPLQILRDLTSLPHKPLLISNRWDIAHTAGTQGFASQFNDFDTHSLADNSQARIFYRVSKEKAVVHHVINQAWRLLQPGGELLLCGEKNQGIKTYIEKAARLFACQPHIQKDGLVYHARLTRSSHTQSPAWLDDQDYPVLREITTADGFTFFSKPGLFGWNKVDQGSALLVEQLPGLLEKRTPGTLLDLGCGYGYLTLATADRHFSRRVATDNNAAALLAMTENARHMNLDVEVIAGDAASGVNGNVDLILCNPPFHQGFDMDGELTDKFLAATRRLLAPTGLAVFVVNQFIPLERKASHGFHQVQTVIQARGFKVLALSRN